MTADSLTLPEGSGFDLWHQTCRPLLDVKSRTPLRRFQAAFEFFNVDGLIFNRTRYSSATFERTARHLRGGEGDLLVLHMLLRGRERGTVEGRELDMGPDRIVLQDWALPFSSVSEESEQLCVAIPRERVPARDWLYRNRPVVGWSRTSPQGAVLANALTSVWSTLPFASLDDAPALASGFLGLLNGLLDPYAAKTGPAQNAATLETMKAYLQMHLSEADLDVGTLVTAFRCSRATVYRIFQEVGGVRTYLRALRMASGFRLLSEAGSPSRSITRVAAECGFRDPAYFHRAFKRRFGITPGEAQENAIRQATAGGRVTATADLAPMLSTLHTWMGATAPK